MEWNLTGKANGNGMDPSGVNRELPSCSGGTVWGTHLREDSDIIILFSPPANHRQTSSDFFIVQICSSFRDSNSSCLPSPQYNVFVLHISHRHLPYLYRSRSHFLNLLFTLIMTLSVLILLFSPSLLCIFGTHLFHLPMFVWKIHRFAATLNLQISICWSFMLNLILRYYYSLLSAFS